MCPAAVLFFAIAALCAPLPFIVIQQRSVEQTFSHFLSFCRTAGAAKILVVSGSGPRKGLDAVQCVERLAKLGPAPLGRVEVGVAFNPYFPDAEAMAEERRRLEAKLRTGTVAHLWLQFGSDVASLEKGLDFIAGVVGRSRYICTHLPYPNEFEANCP